MASKPRQSHNAAIIPAKTLAPNPLCPDWAHWPRLWQVYPEDLATGQEIVQILQPFAMHLLQHGLTLKTRQRHLDHLQMLGGEIIRRRHQDPSLAKLPIQELLLNLIEDDGGPLIWPRITESAQNAFDCTCRKLYRFIDKQKNRL
jgi:hypothetical protein